MGNFFGNIYYLFVGLFGQHLSDYLWGYNCTTTAFDAPVVYAPIGLTMTLVTLGLCVVYYFVLNHPRFNKWWHWLLSAACVFVLNLLIGGIWVDNHLQSGRIPDCLLYTQDGDGGQIQNIFDSNCWMFGLANAIVSFILFFVVSIIVKRWSRNCRHTPWKSIFPKRNK